MCGRDLSRGDGRLLLAGQRGRQRAAGFLGHEGGEVCGFAQADGHHARQAGAGGEHGAGAALLAGELRRRERPSQRAAARLVRRGRQSGGGGPLRHQQRKRPRCWQGGTGEIDGQHGGPSECAVIRDCSSEGPVCQGGGGTHAPTTTLRAVPLRTFSPGAGAFSPGAGGGWWHWWLSATLPAMNETALLNLAADLARHAGAVILAVRARGFETMRKDDHSPVTEADHQAELLIAAGLRQATPDIQVIAEEESAAGRGHDQAAEYWLVDPLDGTREFAAGHDEFTVNIGLVRNGVPVLGVVGVPAFGELFGGIVGRGAWKRTGLGEQAISARTPPAEGLTVLASRHHANDVRLRDYLADRTVARITNYGSALKIARIAEGVADLYPRFGRTMEWDTAGPQAVLEAAGGRLLALDGSPLAYGKPGWENPHFICCGQICSNR